MGMKLAERHTRDQTLFYLRQSITSLSRNSVNSITKAAELGSFLIFLVEHEPRRMSGILKTASQKASAILRVIDAQKEHDKIAEKRAAPSSIDSPKASKRAKLVASASDAAANARSCSVDSQMTDHLPFAPPPYSSQSDAENSRSHTEIDDGVELATPDPSDNLAQEMASAEEPSDDEQGQSEDDDDDEIYGRTHNKVQQEEDERQTTTVKHFQSSSQPVEEHVDNMLQEESRGKVAEEQTTHSETQEMSSSDTNIQIHPAETYYEIERGLTNGDPEIISKLRKNSPILCKPEVDAVFDLCRKLDFIPNRFKLVKHLKNRCIAIGNDKKIDRVPSIYDLEHPDEIYDALSVTHAHTNTSKIGRAFGQMRMFDQVNDEAQKQAATGADVKEDKLRHWHLENRARRKAGDVSDDEKKYIIQSYKNEYYAGSKWTDVCKWFGGKGIVLVFVVADIGSQLIARGLKKEQRLALEELSSFLGSIKKMVSTLGPDALEQYCRHGHLSEAKVKELEELEGGAIENIDGDETEPDEDDD